MRRIAVVTGVVLALVAVGPLLIAQREQLELNDRARDALQGHSFAKLADGFAHYRVEGPEDGPAVVLIHGFSTPLFVWDKVAPSLVEGGFRVVRYDLWGRGLSDRPNVTYTADLFDRQLTELLDTLSISGAVDLVGLSMGGAIAVNFADRHPERVGKIALIAPAGVFDMPAASALLQVPVLGEYLVWAWGDIILTRSVVKQTVSDEADAAAFKTAFGEQLRYKGYKRALVSTMRHGPLTGQDAAWVRVGRQERRGLLIWGTDDTVVPFPVHAHVLELLPWLQFHAIDGGVHCLPYQCPERILPFLLEFLGKDGPA